MPQYDSKTIAKAKLQYSQGHSYRTIGTDLGINYQTIQSWALKGEWIKHELTTKIAQKHEESILEIASRIGATKEHVIRKAFELTNAKNVIIPTGTGYATLPIDENSIKDGGFMGLPEDSLQIVPDRKFQVEGNKLLADVLKMREKGETNVIMPTPIMIMAEDGANIAMLGFQDGNKS